MTTPKQINGHAALGEALREARAALSLRRTECARAAGLSLFIIAGLEDGTIAYPDPYIRFLASAYRIDDYADRRTPSQAS